VKFPPYVRYVVHLLQRSGYSKRIICNAFRKLFSSSFYTILCIVTQRCFTMIYPTRHKSPTHGDCVNFRSGICAINGVAVDSNGSICPNFVPKNAMTTRPIARVHPQARQTYNIYAPRIQSYPLYMSRYPSPTKYNLPYHAWYGYHTPYTVGPAPYTAATEKGGNTLFL